MITLGLSPILKGLNVKDDIIRNMGRYLHQGTKYLKTINIEQKSKYNKAIDYFVKLQKSLTKIFQHQMLNLKQQPSKQDINNR